MALLWTLLILLNVIAGIKAYCIPPDEDDSAWGPWSEWTSCSVSCGGGSRTRTRTCTTEPCTGEATETGHCNYGDCPQTECDNDDAINDVPEWWDVGRVNISTTSGNLMVGTVDVKGQKLGLCWSFSSLSTTDTVTIISPPCNRLRVGAVNGGTPTGQRLGPACTYEVQVDDDVDFDVSDAGGTCDMSQYEAAGDCPISEVVDITFFSQKKDIGVLLNIEPKSDEVSILVGLLGNSNTLTAMRMSRYNATMRAVPGTQWKAVLYSDNNQRVLINGQCSYTTTNDPNQIVFVGPVCGGWGAWGPWEECMSTDEGWRQKRHRPCDSPPPQNDGHCEGDQYEYRTCVCAAPTIPSSATTGELQPGYDWGDMVEVCCKEGYVSELTGRTGFMIGCNYYNRWETFENCIRLECATPVFPNGVVTGAVAPYYQGAEVTVTCNDGYVNEFGDQTFTYECLGTTWWPSGCFVKYCDPLPVIPNGILSVIPGVTSYRPGDTVSVTCQEGYTLSPNTVLKCNDDCRWTPNLMCTATSCATPMDLSQYNIGSLRRSVSSVSMAVITCNEGYTAQGQPSYTSMCQPDGTWSNIQQCEQSGSSTRLEMDAASIGLLVVLGFVVTLPAIAACLWWCRRFFPRPPFRIPRIFPLQKPVPIPPLPLIPPLEDIPPPPPIVPLEPIPSPRSIFPLPPLPPFPPFRPLEPFPPPPPFPPQL